MRLKLVASALLTIAVAACAANDSFSAPTGFARTSSRAGGTPITHVVFIVQENRSFNNLFMGYPGATTRSYGYDTRGNKIKLVSQSLSEGWDIGHNSQDFFNACDGTGKLPGTRCKMDGWNNEFASFGAPKDFAYAYAPRREVDVYWKMAQQYVLADRMFASNLDGSFIAHQYIVAAYASRAVDTPYGAWGCEGGSPDKIPTLTAKRTTGPSVVVCFDNPTIGGEADSAGVTWRFYSGAINGAGGLWSSYQADKQIYYGADWKNDVINPPAQFLADVKAGTLANVTWITPTFLSSDHPGVNPDSGPAWVASLVNAIGESKFWKSSAIFVMWDDWGGWFDPVKPVFEDYDGLGFRVPLLIISPYALQGSVTHEQFETASVLRFMEDTFGLPPMANADTRANDPASDPNAFDFSQQPRAFKKFPGAKPDAYWAQRDRASRDPRTPANILGDD